MSMAVWLGGFGLFFGIIALIVAVIAIILIYTTGNKGPTGATGPAGPAVTYRYNNYEEKSIAFSDTPVDFVSSKLYNITSSTNALVPLTLRAVQGLVNGDTVTVFNGTGSNQLVRADSGTFSEISGYPGGYTLDPDQAVNLTYRASTGSTLPFLIPTSTQ